MFSKDQKKLFDKIGYTKSNYKSRHLKMNIHKHSENRSITPVKIQEQTPEIDQKKFTRKKGRIDNSFYEKRVRSMSKNRQPMFTLCDSQATLGSFVTMSHSMNGRKKQVDSVATSKSYAY
jgi:hypothetical protein